MISWFPPLLLALAAAAGPETHTLNGLKLTLDPASGGVLSLEYSGMCFVQAASGTASLLEIASPGQGFDPLRMGARYSQGARVAQEGDALVVSWEALGASRALPQEGQITGRVRIAPMADGRSVSLQATLLNHTPHTIPQVLFPDLAGVQPFAGREETELRTCGLVKKPFVDLDLPEDEGRWYASRRNWMELKSGAYDKSMAARWLDVGSLDGGFSLFPRLWSWGPLTAQNEPATDTVRLHLSQVDKSLRIMCEHRTDIAPGGSWTSPEYVLTPHEHGWARGIEPFRAWVAENMQRPHPLPERLSRSIGYRSVWMAQQYAEHDPAPPTVVWRFNDLPALADESLAHGLNEMVIWLWQPWEIPDQPSPALGTREEFAAAIEACRARGVNVSLFVSVMTLLDPIPSRYGWEDKAEYWGYHTDFVPMLRPYYGQASRGSFAVQSHPQWQADVRKSLLQLIAQGWSSITWDQARYAPLEPNIAGIFEEVRAAARKHDPESTFAGECLNNLDLDARWLDYTWNWALYDDTLDWRALVNAYPAPRFNVNVGTSAQAVKRLFMDHLFLNVLPSRPEGINGSARIADFPALGAALKTCATLHKKFQPYLEQGVMIGDCILAAPCPTARVNAYLQEGRALILLMNTSPETATVSFTLDLAPWLAAPGPFNVSRFDEAGTRLENRIRRQARWTESFRRLAPGEFALVEIVPG